jgi:hypothetical protein
VTLQIVGFKAQKAGNASEEYEDAWAFSLASPRVAVSDGATDSFESGLWARALVQHVMADPPGGSAEEMAEWLASPIKAWHDGINWSSLPWYGAEKASRGAFATLVTVEFQDPPDAGTEVHVGALRYRATAIGDACLFHVQDDQLIVRFPLTLSADFGTTPPLLSTRDDYNRKVLKNFRTMAHEVKPGDLMVLATDAFAAWFLRDFEDGGKPWLRLLALSDTGFEDLVGDLRQGRMMHNDDVTLVVVSVASATTQPPHDASKSINASSEEGC